MPYKVLREPIIISKIGPDPDKVTDMYLRQDIQVNKYLAEVYYNGNIVDNEGKIKKFIDITNPIQGRHLYNLVFQNKYVNTL